MPYPNEHSCRLEPPDNFVRFRRENNFQGSGYAVIWGITKDGKATMQAIRYPTGKWTEARAKNHCSDKGGSFHPASQAALAIEGLQLAYAARFEPIIDGDRTFVKIYAIDNSKCRNKWRVTKDAMQRAAKTILAAKLLGPPPPGEEGDVIEATCPPHIGRWKDVGKFVNYQQNGQTYGLAEVLEPYAAKNVRERKWRATSPKIIVNAERHENGEIEVSDYRFDHVLFVEDPAFPKSGVVQVCDSPESCGFPSNCLAGALEAAFDESFTVMAEEALIDAEMTALGLHPEKKSKNENLKENDPLNHPLELAAGWLPQGMTQTDLGDGDFAWLSNAYKRDEVTKDEGRKLPYKIHGKVNENGWKAAMAAASGARADMDFVGGPNKLQVIRKLCRDKPEGVESAVCDELESKGGCTNLTGENEGSQKCIAEMQDTIKTLGARVDALDTSNKDLVKTNEELKTANKQLMDDKTGREQAEHLALVNSVVDLRVKAGHVKEEERAKTMEIFAKMPNDALTLMKVDLEKQVMAVAASVDQAKAKAKFRAGKTDTGLSVGWWNAAEKKWEA
jgi:hypothetical protein